MTTLESIQALPLVGILRGCAEEDLSPVVEAVRRGRMTSLEITMNSTGAADQIARAVALAGNSIQIGAGTVTSVDLLEQALRAGARFIVTPFLAVEVIKQCVKRQIPVFPGALSPTEIQLAWELGATMVKVFPAELGGAHYLRALRGPFPQIRLMPTGGVTLATLPALFRAGASGFGVGSPLFRPDRIKARDWGWLENEVRAFVQAYQTVSSQHVQPVNAGGPRRASPGAIPPR